MSASSAVVPTSSGLTLADLAGRIRQKHQAATTAMRDAVLHAIDTGNLLIEAKKKLKHGNWLEWLEQNCPDISERTCQGYMRLARMPDEKAQRVADLPLREALSAIRSREKQLAEATAKEAEPPGRPQICYTPPGDEPLFGREALAYVPPRPPPSRPMTEDEIADQFIDQLVDARVRWEEPFSDDALRLAFDRRLGKREPVISVEPDTTSAAERKALYAETEDVAPKTFPECKSAIVTAITHAWNVLSDDEWKTLQKLLIGTLKNLPRNAAATAAKDAA